MTMPGKPGKHHHRDKDQDEVDLVIETGSGALVGIEVKASATVNASDFKGLRKLAEACGDNFKMGVVLYDGEGRSPSATVLWLRQCLACGRDSIFAVFGRSGCSCCNTSYIAGSDDGLDFQPICGLQKEPTSEKSQ
jgi:hypothetical protein